MDEIQSKTWIEISQVNLIYNINKFRDRIGDSVKFCAVVKSDAYGHGAKEIVGIAKDYVDWFAVDSLEEAMEIKDLLDGKPILILGYTLFENLHVVAENNFHQVVANIETVEKLIDCLCDVILRLTCAERSRSGTNRNG